MLSAIERVPEAVLAPREAIVEVPETVSVAPEGSVNVSPESPRVNAVPVDGLTLLVFTSLIICS
jgi:hypothetical protein